MYCHFVHCSLVPLLTWFPRPKCMASCGNVWGWGWYREILCAFCFGFWHKPSSRALQMAPFFGHAENSLGIFPNFFLCPIQGATMQLKVQCSRNSSFMSSRNSWILPSCNPSLLCISPNKGTIELYEWNLGPYFLHLSQMQGGFHASQLQRGFSKHTA